MYIIEEFNPEFHHQEVCRWWQARQWPTMPVEAFPKNGLMVSHDGTLVMAGWLYLTDSMWAILEWIVGNPDVYKETRTGALDVLIPALLDIAKTNGKKIVFSSVNHPSLIAAYGRHGMIVSDKGMTNFVWRAK